MVLIQRTITVAVVLTLLLLSGRQDAANALDIARYLHHVQPGATMTLECLHRNRLEINWYRMDKNVPSNCQITTREIHNKGWWTQLQCSNMAVKDEGIYACKKYYDDGPGDYWDVVVGSCLCFGPTINCGQNAKVTMESKEVQLFSESSSPILLTTTYNPQTIIPNYTVFKDENVAGVSQSKVNGTVYYALSKQITDLKLKLYGGAFTYELFSFFQKTNIKNEIAPLALIRDGDGKVLVYRETGTYNRNTNLRRISFSKYNWHALTGDSVTDESAREEDVMRILSNLDEIYIRVHYDVNDFISRYAQVDLSTVKFVNDGLDMPSSNGKCSCPAGYTGNYCERCAANYTGNPVKNSSCKLVPEADRLNYTADSANDKDDASGKTNLSSTVQTEMSNKDSFLCNGRRIPFSKACDGHFDCNDGRDEICNPRKCEINQCRCSRTKQCIQRNQSHFFLYEDIETHIKVNSGDSMILECPIRIDHPLIVINWYRNNMGVPVKCQVFTNPTKSNRVSRLHCRNMTINDAGVYTCEQYYTVYDSTPNTVMSVKVFLNAMSDASRKNSCFCFGVTNSCQRINKPLSNDLLVQTFSDSLPPILLSTMDTWKTIISNYTILESMGQSTIFKTKVNGTIFYPLSQEITKRRLELYQGALHVDEFPRLDSIIQDENSPLALMHGGGKVLVYYESGIYNRNSHHRRLSFSKQNWHVLHGDKVDEQSASEEDVMRVLNNLDKIYIRLIFGSEYFARKYSNYSKLSFFDFKTSVPKGRAFSIDKCSCPAGCDGIYCESCAKNYTRNPLESVSIIHENEKTILKPLINAEKFSDIAAINGTIDMNNIKNEGDNYFRCEMGEIIPFSKVCDGRIDCNNGRDEICHPEKCGDVNKCQCAHTNQCIKRNQSHFYLYNSEDYSKSRMHVNPGDSMVLECRLSDDYVEFGVSWYQNDMNVPEKCHITDPTKSDPVSRLHCPNMTINDEGVYSCEGSNRDYRHSILDVIVFVGDKSSIEQDSCFCFGVSNTCDKSNVTVKHEEFPFSTSLSPILLAPINEGERRILNYTIFDGKTIDDVSELKVNGTIYYSLSENVTKKELKLYGGSIRYRFHDESTQGTLKQHEKTPLALMRGHDIVLAYYENAHTNSYYKRLSFTKHNWYLWNENTMSQKKVSESDVMMVLSNLGGIYVRVHYDFNDEALGSRMMDLSTVEFANDGLDIIPSTIGKCFCPLGYTGVYCEKCAGNYTGDPTENIPCVYDSRYVEPVPDDLNIDEAAGQSNTEFECTNGVIIQFNKICDGILDCADGVDEKCIAGACDSFNECKCVANNKCTRRKESDFYLFNDDGDLPLNLYTLPGLPMTLQCPTVNAVDTKWYWNNETVPSDCTTVNHTDNSTLSCPNATSLHEGVYSCERYYDSSESDPETIRAAVLVGEEAFYKQGSCFCFGASVTSCELVNVSTSFQYCQRFQSSSPAAVLAALNGQLTLFPIDGERSQVDELNGAVYYALSDDITNLKLKLYGGFIPIGSVQVKQRIGGTNVNAPLAVMHGDGRVLLYYQDGKYGSTVNHGGLIFSAPNWIMLHRDGTVSRVTTRDMMKVLSHLDAIYVSDVPAGNEYKNIYSKIQFGSTELGIPLPAVPKCSCPPEYAGIYCEKCAENCSGDPMNNVPCVPNVHKAPMITGHTLEGTGKKTFQRAVIKKVDNGFTCSDGLRAMSSSEVCDGNISCRDGSDEMCFHNDKCLISNYCFCVNKEMCISRHRAHFYLFEVGMYSTPYFTARIGDTMILECPINSLEKRSNDTKTIAWYQNDGSIPSKCQTSESSDWVSRLTCPNMTIDDQAVYSCKENDMDRYRSRDVIAYLRTEDSDPLNPCFCFGVTTTCQRAHVKLEHTMVIIFPNSSLFYLPTSWKTGNIVVPNHTMFENGNLGTESLSQNNAIPYYPLSKEITNMKLKLYNGYLKFTPFNDDQFTTNDEIAPLAIMRGDDKVLVYYDKAAQYLKTWYRSVKVDFSMYYNWFTLHGETAKRASQEDFMRVMNNLDGIYIRVFHNVNDTNIHTLSYYLRPTAIKCSCPTGYAGNYCERCADNYIRGSKNHKSCVLTNHEDEENVTEQNESPGPVSATPKSPKKSNASNDTIVTTPPSKSGPNSAHFLSSRSFDCLLLYFCSLCCTILWHRFV